MTVMLVVDLSASEKFGTSRAFKTRVAGEVAAMLAFSAIRNNDRVGPHRRDRQDRAHRSPRRRAKPRDARRAARSGIRSSRQAVHVQVRGVAALAAVARGRLEGTPWARPPNSRPALEALVHVARRRSIAFVISDFYDTGYERALALVLGEARRGARGARGSRATPSCPTWGWRASRISRAAKTVIVDTS